MEETTIYIDFDPNPQLCPTWEVVCTEFAFPLPGTSHPEETPKLSQTVVQITKNPTRRAKPKPEKAKEVTEPGPDCGCPIKCYKKIGKDAILKIFRDFWALADYNSQNAYLFALIECIGVKRRYTKNETSRRNYTIVYHVKDNGRNVPVCKKAFLNIHGLQHHRGRVNNLANKIKEGESAPPPDKRGRHANRPNAYSEDAVEHVRRHLLLCPKADRRRNTGKTMALSTKLCYGLYVNEYCKNNQLVPVSLDKFRRVFATEGYKNARKGVRKSGEQTNNSEC